MGPRAASPPLRAGGPPHLSAARPGPRGQQRGRRPPSSPPRPAASPPSFLPLLRPSAPRGAGKVPPGSGAAPTPRVRRVAAAPERGSALLLPVRGRRREMAAPRAPRAEAPQAAPRLDFVAPAPKFRAPAPKFSGPAPKFSGPAYVCDPWLKNCPAKGCPPQLAQGHGRRPGVRVPLTGTRSHQPSPAGAPLQKAGIGAAFFFWGSGHRCFNPRRGFCQKIIVFSEVSVYRLSTRAQATVLATQLLPFLSRFLCIPPTRLPPPASSPLLLFSSLLHSSEVSQLNPGTHFLHTFTD